MSDKEIGNQNQVVNNYEEVVRNNVGAFDQALKDHSSGKTPTVEGGGDPFNMVSEAVLAKAGPIGFAADIFQNINTGSPHNSAFWGTTTTSKGSGRKNRKDIMSPIGSSAPVSKGNHHFWASSGLTFTGDKIDNGQKKKFPTKGDIMNEHAMRGAGLHKITERIMDANKASNNRTVFEDVMGSDMGHEVAKQSLKSQQPEEVLRMAQAMTETKRDELVQEVMTAEHYFWHKLQTDKSADAQKVREEIEEKARPGIQAAQKNEPADPAPADQSHMKQPEQQVMATAPSAPKPKLMAPKAPSWARPPEGYVAEDEEDARG